MEKCWRRRGCDDEMQGRCPHNIPGEPCPADCHFAACQRKTHVVCDYDAAVKEICRFCEHFLTYGPNIADRPADFKRQGNPNRFLL